MQILQAVEGHAAAVVKQRHHARSAGVILRTCGLNSGQDAIRLKPQSLGTEAGGMMVRLGAGGLTPGEDRTAIGVYSLCDLVSSLAGH